MRTSEPYPYSRFEREGDMPTLGELEAEEHDDPLWGMVRCRYGCRSYFHGHDTTAALRHYEVVHGE